LRLNEFNPQPPLSKQFLSNPRYWAIWALSKSGNLGILIESSALLQQKTAARQNMCDLNRKEIAESTIPEKTLRSLRRNE